MPGESSESKQETSAALRNKLREVFGYTDFLPHQEGIINAILDGQDVFAVMPTGGGKSLCYQLPACLMPGTCIVISPLISLMQDQVSAARSLGIQAEFLNSSLPRDEVARVIRRAKAGDLDLLYLAPERFNIASQLDMIRGIDTSLFAIDEAHCISEWGHDFRPDYLALSIIPHYFPRSPVAAFTATATLQVQDDISDKLGLRDPFTVRASFDRPNICYQVVNKGRTVEHQVLDFVKSRPLQPGIVYRTTRESVERCAAYLAGNGIEALPYHAAMNARTRQEHQERFNRDDIQVIVATIAFGMGIDKSNVRFVIHADLPKNLESYSQETGRAGRDGEPAECILFFRSSDAAKHLYFIDKIEDEKQRSSASRKLRRMTRFATLHRCRRRELLAYFGEEYPEASCGCCDVCAGNTETVDATTEGRILLSAVARTGQRFGVGHIADVVRGAKTKRIRNLGHDKLKTYGAGADRPKQYWRTLTEELIAHGHLLQTGDRFPVLKITSKGKDLLFGQTSFKTVKRDTPDRDPAEEISFEDVRLVRAWMTQHG